MRDGETFTVVDLFGRPAETADNTAENDASYADLTRPAFEANYLRFHEALPAVVEGLSSSVRSHVAPRTVRFAHIDGSHLYDVVRDDALAAREYMAEHGVVAFDDFRTAHAPGTAAAIWETVVTDGLVPIAVTDTKLYGVWGTHGAELQRRLMDDV